jgi:membrane fusion protein (multidrug efflux system)
VPVRIALDAEQLKANPLRVGLSMDAEVDVSSKDGQMLATAPRPKALSQTQVYSALDRGADAEVQRIIAANLGSKRADAAVLAQPAQQSAQSALLPRGSHAAHQANPS